MQDGVRGYGPGSGFGAITVVVVVGLGMISGTGLGWIAALSSTPGTIRTWLSPPTALGLVTGGAVRAVGFGDHVDLAVQVFRGLATLAAVGILLYLVLRPRGRLGAGRGAGAVDRGRPGSGGSALGPALVAAGDRGRRMASRWLHATILITAVLTLHGVAGTSATSDALFEFSDGLGLLLVALVLAVIVWASPRERVLLLGDLDDPGLVPDDRPAQARFDQMVISR